MGVEVTKRFRNSKRTHNEMIEHPVKPGIPYT